MPPSNVLFLQRLGIKYPIIQAPMAGTSTPTMAAAVSNAGGLGSIGIGAATAAKARDMIQETKKLTNRPFNVNVFVHVDPQPDAARDAAWIDQLRPEFARLGAEPPAHLATVYQSFATSQDVIDMLLEEKPSVVSFHFGLPPSATIAALKAYGATLLATATSVDEARAIEAAGVDAIVAQGIEAGGHRGMFDPSLPDDQLGVLALTALLVKSVSIPVISAGGIMTGRGVRAALDVGAIAAQLGTAFVGCPESDADEGYRAALAGEPAYHTRLTEVISGRPARSLATRWTELGGRSDRARAAAYPNAYDAAKQLHALAKAKGDWSYGAYWSGQGAPLSRPMPAAKLFQTLVEELEETRAAVDKF